MTLLHVMHVPTPERQEVVARLRTVADVCLHTDVTRRGVMWNWSRAVRCASLDSGRGRWSLIVQDDMMPIGDRWKSHLLLATQHSPSKLLGLAWVFRQFEKAVEHHRPYIIGNYILRGGAIAYHRSLLPELADFSEQAATTTDYPHDDMALCEWAQFRKGFKPALVSRSIFASLPIRSEIGHPVMTTGRYTVETPTLDGRPLYWDVEDYQRSSVTNDTHNKRLLAEFRRQMGWTS